jgi:hypothetical protein
VLHKTRQNRFARLGDKRLHWSRSRFCRGSHNFPEFFLRRLPLPWPRRCAAGGRWASHALTSAKDVAASTSAELAQSLAFIESGDD